MQQPETINNVQEDKSFEERARDFLRDLNEGKGFIKVHREVGHDVAGLKVGAGEHTGLVFKDGKVFHAKEAGRYYDVLVEYFKERGYEPNIYELVKPMFFAAGERYGVIQEYFTEPCLSELMGYFFMMKEIKKREKKLQRELNTEETGAFRFRFFGSEDSRLRCEQFVNRQPNRDITLDDMAEVQREFGVDTDYLGLSIKSDNVIVLDQRRIEDWPKIGLAIIDY